MPSKPLQNGQMDRRTWSSGAWPGPGHAGLWGLWGLSSSGRGTLKCLMGSIGCQELIQRHQDYFCAGDGDFVSGCTTLHRAGHGGSQGCGGSTATENLHLLISSWRGCLSQPCQPSPGTRAVCGTCAGPFTAGWTGLGYLLRHEPEEDPCFTPHHLQKINSCVLGVYFGNILNLFSPIQNGWNININKRETTKSTEPCSAKACGVWSAKVPVAKRSRVRYVPTMWRLSLQWNPDLKLLGN